MQSKLAYTAYPKTEYNRIRIYMMWWDGVSLKFAASIIDFNTASNKVSSLSSSIWWALVRYC